jgi:hypothetical protein
VYLFGLSLLCFVLGGANMLAAAGPVRVRPSMACFAPAPRRANDCLRDDLRVGVGSASRAGHARATVVPPRRGPAARIACESVPVRAVPLSAWAIAMARAARVRWR